MGRRPPRPTLTDPLFPYPTLFLSEPALERDGGRRCAGLLTAHDESQVAAPAGDAGLGDVSRPVDHGDRQRRDGGLAHDRVRPGLEVGHRKDLRSEEHTSELQSLMRNSYAVFCLKNKKDEKNN